MRSPDVDPSESAGPPRRRWTCVDSHAHLAMTAFEEDRDTVLARASAAGITHVLTASTTLEDAPGNVRLAAAAGAPRVLAAVGVHPHEAKRWTEGDDRRLAEMASGDRVVAIGEAGLDYHYDFSPRDRQRDVLSRQVRIASRLGLPLVVHCRRAADDVAAILEGEGAERCGGVIHCFTEDDHFARRALALGFYISFSGILTFKTSAALRAVARQIPQDKLLVETDAPYLAPVPFRGRRNEPVNALVVLEELARIREVEPAELASTITANFLRFTGSLRA